MTPSKSALNPQQKGTSYSDDSKFMDQFIGYSDKMANPIRTPMPSAMPLSLLKTDAATPVPTPAPTMVNNGTLGTLTGAAILPSQTALTTGTNVTNATSYKNALDASGAWKMSIISGFTIALVALL